MYVNKREVGHICSTWVGQEYFSYFFSILLTSLALCMPNARAINVIAYLNYVIPPQMYLNNSLKCMSKKKKKFMIFLQFFHLFFYGCLLC